jgi:hypothetical protein
MTAAGVLSACSAPGSAHASADDPVVRPLASEPADDAEPAPPDASGCTVQLAPTVDPDVPSVLAAPGPWQLCGTYGTGRADLLTVSDDSRRLAMVTDSGQAWVLNARNFKLLGVFAHATGAVSFAGLSPDGKFLATVDDLAGRVAIWNVAKQKLLRVLTRPPASISYYNLGALAFSHDGSKLAVVSVSHIDVFDTATGAPLPISARTDLGGAMSVAFAANDTRLVLGRFTYWGNGPYSGWGGADVLDAATGDNRVGLAKDFYIDLPNIVVSGNGNSIAIGATSASPSITFFDPTTGQITRDLPVAGRPLALDTDGSHMAMVDPPPDDYTPSTSVSIRTTADGAIVKTVALPESPSPNGRLLGATPDLTGVLVGDGVPAVLTRLQAKNGRTHAVACGTGHSDDLSDLAITSDGKTLVTTGGYSDNRASLAWNVATGAPVAPPPPESLRHPSATSPDGILQAAPQSDDWSQNFDLINTATGDVVRTMGPQPSRPRTFDFSPDDASVASSSERDPADRRAPPVANIWSVSSGEVEDTLRILTTVPETNPQPVLFGDVNHLFVAGHATAARWCRAGH